jgi:prepilin-type N-terminal cleavage/methylation domain-containing protein
MSKQIQQKGFTIIEVVLVLAIAGLIFLMVFLALPDLERARRNTQRKSDAGHILSALESYAANSGGQYPAATQAAFAAFMTAYEPNLVDPTTGAVYATNATDAAPTAAGQVEYQTGANCNGAGGTLQTGTGNSRQIALVMFLEPNATSCQANN